jgi:hypothetical protein
MISILAGSVFADPIPVKQLDFIGNYCLDCHDEDTAKGDLNLEIEKVDWSSATVRHHWEDLFTRVQRHKMPPPKKKTQPTPAERTAFLTWLDGVLMDKSPIGGAPMRRLNRREYLQSMRTIFDGIDVELPGSFPQDVSAHGFDTNAKELVVSPSHLEAYAESAIMAADRLFPPELPTPEPKAWQVPPADLTISYSSSTLIDGAMRLASSGNKTRNATWPTKFSAPASGIYRVKITLSAKKPPASAPPEFQLGAHSPYLKGGRDRALESFTVTTEEPEVMEAEVTLYSGETLLFSYANAPLNYEKSKGLYRPFLEKELAANPRLAAAWAKVKKVPRGGNGWARVKEVMKTDKTLKAGKYAAGSEALEKVVKAMIGNSVSSGETIVYKYFEEGPNLGIHNLEISGPHELIEDDRNRKQKNLQSAFLGKEGRKTDDASIRAVLSRHLLLTFRRPVDAAEIEPYLALVKQELDAGKRIDEGYHLAIRASLTSPKFIYRERGDTLDAYELASRLSYFLSGRQPDDKLLVVAASGKLGKSEIFRRSAQSMLKRKHLTTAFIRDFTGQWLDTNELDTLMPDPKLFPNFTNAHLRVMKQEVELTFDEILTKNRPAIDFINPDFIYTDPSLGMHLYQLAEFQPRRPTAKGRPQRIPSPGKLKRVAIKRGQRRGGLLTMPAVMTATANGVDTQAVVRGVWVLENLIGMPPPEPPKAVPALPPDISGAKSPKEILAAHTKSPSCASCHEDIDPVGFVLENLDAVGRWRTSYPTRSSKKKTIPVDATGQLPDGTKLQDVRDLKKWLAANPHHFTNCLSQKLLEYATGRHLNYRERKIVGEICDKNLKANRGFQDLLLDLIDSEVFRAR